MPPHGGPGGFHDEGELGRIQDIKYLRRLWRYARPYRKLLLLALVLLLLMSCVDLALPILQKYAMDGAIDTGAGPEYDRTAALFAEADGAKPPKAIEDYAHSAHAFDPMTTWVPADAEDARAIAHMQLLREYALHPDGAKAVATALERERSERLDMLYLIAAIFFIAVVIQVFFRVASVLTMEYAGQGIMMDLRMHIYRHLSRLHLAFFDGNPTGRLVTRATNDVQAVYEAFNAVLVQSAADIFRFIGILAAMFILSWKLTAFLFITIPAILIVSFLFRVLHRKAYRRVRKTLARINSFLSENLSGIRVVKMFRREKKNLSNFDKINGNYYSANINQLIVNAIFQPIMSLVRVVAMGMLLWYGGREFMQGRIDKGTLIAFIWYIEMFYAPIVDLSAKYNILQGAIAAGERIFLLLDEKPLIAQPEKPFVPDVFRGRIEFRDITFEYKPGEPVLKNISFTVEPGHTFALVGATGSGKTTITNLACRFYDVKDGAVLVDGVDVREWDLRELRRRIAIVMQDVFIFSGTVADNIRLGEREIPYEKMEWAAAMTGMDGFIEKLEDGYGHIVRERGANFSTGERQLLAFTRALAFEPGVLVLDEATASIDTRTEQLIQDALEKLLSGRTSIVVAHRLSTIRKADRIIVLSHGNLVEQGTHEQLMAQHGLYHRLYRLQFDTPS